MYVHETAFHRDCQWNLTYKQRAAVGNDRNTKPYYMIPLAWVAEPAKSFFGARYLNNGLVLWRNVHSYKAEEKLFKVAPESTKLIGYR